MPMLTYRAGLDVLKVHLYPYFVYGEIERTRRLFLAKVIHAKPSDLLGCSVIVLKMTSGNASVYMMLQVDATLVKK